MKTLFSGIGLAFLFIIGVASLFIADFACAAASDVASTARQELSASVLLKKYSTFKDMHAALSSKQESIKLMEATFKTTWEDLDTPRSEWPRDERQQYSHDKAAVQGMKLSFNSLAAEYNAGMAKIHFAFCNIGELPKGASEPLPREYVHYQVN